jgi:hypothetical protein
MNDINKAISDTAHSRSVGLDVMRSTEIDYGQAVMLSPESLLAYCSKQLRDLGTQIQGMLNEQGSLKDKCNILSDLKKAITAKSAGWKEGDKTDKAEVAQAYLNAARALPPGPERDAVLKELDAFRQTAFLNDVPVSPPSTLANYNETTIAIEAEKSHEGALNAVEPTEMRTRSEAIDSITGDVTREVELKMISLQSMISQRQMIVQLTTNLIQKLNDTLAAPIANMK